MCGRFAFFADIEEVRAQFALKQNVVLKPRYNIAPTQLIPVIRNVGLLEFLPWGLRPVWLKPDQNSFVNARVETAHEKPAFRQAFKKRRCLIIANGYYEWKQIGNNKQPYFIALPDKKLFAFAGLCEADTCAIITRPAYNQEILAVHERMPVIIEEEQYAQWLDVKTNFEILQAIMHTKHHLFTVDPVTTKVNNPKNDIVECTLSLQ